MKTWLACAIWWLVPATAWAQSVSALRLPVTVSVGGGMLMPYSYPDRPTTDLFVSAQVPVSESLLVEGQVLRSTSGHTTSGYFDNRSDRPFTPFSTVETDHEALNVGGNLLMRTGGTRLKLFFGGGLGFHQAETHMRFDTRCEPRAAGGCEGQADTSTDHEFVWSGPSWQLVGGFEGRIAPRLAAFGGARWLTTSLWAGDTGLGALGGVRLALGAPATQEAQPRNPTVRVSLVSGVRHTGEFVSLTSSEVVVREEGQPQTFPLAQVSRVERTTHNVRNGVLWGLIVGFAGGYLGSCGGGDEEDCWPEVGAVFAGIGAGTGGLIGAGINRATAESRVMYSNPEVSVSMAPRVSPSRVGLDLSVRFQAASSAHCRSLAEQLREPGVTRLRIPGQHAETFTSAALGLAMVVMQTGSAGDQTEAQQSAIAVDFGLAGRVLQPPAKSGSTVDGVALWPTVVQRLAFIASLPRPGSVVRPVHGADAAKAFRRQRARCLGFVSRMRDPA